MRAQADVLVRVAAAAHCPACHHHPAAPPLRRRHLLTPPPPPAHSLCPPLPSAFAARLRLTHVVRGAVRSAIEALQALERQVVCRFDRRLCAIEVEQAKMAQAIEDSIRMKTEGNTSLTAIISVIHMMQPRPDSLTGQQTHHYLNIDAQREEDAVWSPHALLHLFTFLCISV